MLDYAATNALAYFGRYSDGGGKSFIKFVSGNEMNDVITFYNVFLLNGKRIEITLCFDLYGAT
jgi:hypothetical protein